MAVDAVGVRREKNAWGGGGGVFMARVGRGVDGCLHWGKSRVLRYGGRSLKYAVILMCTHGPRRVIYYAEKKCLLLAVKCSL